MASKGEDGGSGRTTSSSPRVRGRGELPEQGRTVAVADHKAFKGIRMRRWGKWVSEIRIPRSRTRIWLGSYDAPEKAARAYDAALYCLQGGRGHFNFPHGERPGFSEDLRLALSKADIKAIAARFASSSSSHPSAPCHSLPPSSPPASPVAARWSDDSELRTKCDDEGAAGKCDDDVVNHSVDEDCGSLFCLDDLLLGDPYVSETSSIWDFL